MLRIVVVLKVSALLALAGAPVLKTGQVNSYGEFGIIVTDGSIKDDGYYQAGSIRNYGRSGNVVTDNTTGLEWLDNVSIKKKWAEASGDTAAAYCAALYSGSKYHWRLPTIQELQTLVDSSQDNPSVTEGIFTNIVASTNWSSTERNIIGMDQAWAIHFYGGDTIYSNQSNSLYVRCVRNQPLNPSSLSRNDAAEIVTDDTTGLQWQDNSDAETLNTDWISAISYCEETLTLGGYSDWRMPNKNELLSIVDYMQYNPSVSSTFQHISSSNYWSSTTVLHSTNLAWSIDFRLGRTGNSGKTANQYIRCVRGGQLGNAAIPSIIMYLLD